MQVTLVQVVPRFRLASFRAKCNLSGAEGVAR